LTRAGIYLLCAVVLVGLASSQDDVVRIGPGVTPPKIINKAEPIYPEEARGAGVQGAVVIEVIIDESGRVAQQSVLSPLGFGLDESALAATAAWTFHPVTKDGKPVKFLATIEVNFHLSGRNFDEAT
jgi:TonB family protein